MRIGVFHNLPFGGALRVACEQARRLGDEVDAVYVMSSTPSEWSFEKPVHRYHVRTRRLLRSPFGRLNGLLNMLSLIDIQRMSKVVANEIDSAGYDVVLVGPCKITQTPPLLRYLKTPSVYYCQEPFRAVHEALLKGHVFLPWDDPLRSLYSRAIIANESRGMQSAATVLCNSCYSREVILRTYGVDAHVNYLAVDRQVFRPLGIPKENLVLSVGRLSFLKGHEFVLESISLIEPERRPTLGVVAGPSDPGSVARLKNLGRARGVDVQVYEDVSDTALVELYNTAAVTALAPILEPFGLVAVESMACGTPVVGVAEAGVRESVTDGVTGILVSRDTAEFASALISVLADPGMAGRMGAAGIRMAQEKWDWDRSIADLRHYLELAASR